MNKTKVGGSQAVQQVSVADELLKYKQLYDAGVLTDEEFETKKKELLAL
nr:SHOCT domain-containing protein [Paeniclostridium sordellii]